MPNLNFQNPTVNLIIQITSGLIVVLILYIITLVILRIDSIVSISSNKVSSNTSTLIVDGHAPVSWLSQQKFNTTNQHARNFKPIPRSLNRRGGAQLTYQFWIKIESHDHTKFNDLIILMRGDNRKYQIGLYHNNRLERIMPEDYAIACPLIKFQDSYKSYRIQLNTNNSPYTYVDLKPNEGSTGLDRRNLFSLLTINDWFLFTFILEDNYSVDNGHENGIRMRFWFNDTLYNEEYSSLNFTPFVKNFIKENEGDLYLFPNYDAKIHGDLLKLANIKYYNYVVSDQEIINTYKAGPPVHSAMASSTKVTDFELSAFNKIDIYNR